MFLKNPSKLPGISRWAAVRVGRGACRKAPDGNPGSRGAGSGRARPRRLDMPSAAATGLPQTRREPALMARLPRPSRGVAFGLAN